MNFSSHFGVRGSYLTLYKVADTTLQYQSDRLLSSVSWNYSHDLLDVLQYYKITYSPNLVFLKLILSDNAIFGNSQLAMWYNFKHCYKMTHYGPMLDQHR